MPTSTGRFSATKLAWSSIAPLIGAFVWLGVVMVRLRAVDERWWIARDDAIITLSHSKNAAEHGTIGVSPGGDRVEGFSSPLQFAAAYVVQLVTSIDYRPLTILLMAIAVAVAGLLCVIGFRAAAGDDGWSRWRAEVVALALATVTVLIIASSWTVTGWLGSGMENPMILVAGVGVACGGWLFPRRGWISAVVLVVGLVALGLARVELLALMLPLLAAVGVLVWEQRRGWRTPVLVVGVPALVVGFVHVGRWRYFGEWLPNTAVVQQRSTGVWNIATILLITVAFCALLGRYLVRGHVVGAARRRLLLLVCAATFLLAATALWWLSATGRTGGSLDRLVSFSTFLSLLLIAVLAFLVARYLRAEVGAMEYLLVALVLVPVGQFLATGPARLDEFRVAGVAVAFLGLLICALALKSASALRFAGTSVSPPRNQAVGVVAVGAAVAVVGIGWLAWHDGSRKLNYEIAWANDIVEVAEGVRDEELGGEGLPILANTDLGKVSYSKVALMVDLGLLGDPLLTLVTQEDPDLVTTYLLEVASPDVVNTQGGWSCTYGEWLRSPAFAETYEVVERRRTVGNRSCPKRGAFVIWQRADGTEEYRLTRALLAEDDPTASVSAAVEECAGSGASPFRCEGVRRSIQRAAEQLRRRGRLDDAVAALSASPSLDLDRPMLERKADWASAAHAAFVRLARGS